MLPRLAEEALLASAVRRSRLHDFGDGRFRAGLRVQAEALDREARANRLNALLLRPLDGLVGRQFARRSRYFGRAHAHQSTPSADPRNRGRVQVRYDLYIWLDKRASTLARIPSPENRFLVSLEGRL